MVRTFFFYAVFYFLCSESISAQQSRGFQLGSSFYQDNGRLLTIQYESCRYIWEDDFAIRFKTGLGVLNKIEYNFDGSFTSSSSSTPINKGIYTSFQFDISGGVKKYLLGGTYDTKGVYVNADLGVSYALIKIIQPSNFGTVPNAALTLAPGVGYSMGFDDYSFSVEGGYSIPINVFDSDYKPQKSNHTYVLFTQSFYVKLGYTLFL